MNICKRCGKENQEHYKFCLGCGGELTSATPAAGGGGGGAQKTIMASALGPGPIAAPLAATAPGGGAPMRMPTPPAGMAPVSPPGAPGMPPPLSPPPLAPPPLSAAPAPQAQPLGGYPAPAAFPQQGGPRGVEARTMMAAQAVSPPPQAMPSPSGFPPGMAAPPQPSPFSPQAYPGMPPSPGSPPFTPVGPAPTPIGGPSANASAPIPAVAPPGATAGAVTRTCPNCGTEVPATFLFCGACGQRLEPSAGPGAMPGRSTGDLAARAVPAPEPKPHGRLTLIRPDGSEGGVHDLDEGENQIGRQHGALFENDGYLSPRHAERIINAAGAVIRDLDSLNGVFCKMAQEEELQSGDVFRIGQELLRFDAIPPPQPLEDGTEVMGSPNPGYWGRLSVIIGKDIDGSAYPLFGDAVTIGRERGDINFPDDGYVSGLHARISYRDGKTFLTDLGSSNGTFARLRGDRVVQDGAFVLFGQQLFRVNLNVG